MSLGSGGGGLGDTSLQDFGGSPFDFANYQSYSPQISPLSYGSSSSGGLGDFGQGISDRISSIGNSPNITGDNILQAGINAGGLFSPLVPIGAGILQGFNVLDPGQSTNNAAADFAMKPGFIQNTTADLANWVDRHLFGGDYMPIPNPQPQDVTQRIQELINSGGFSDHSSGSGVDIGNQWNLNLPGDSPGTQDFGQMGALWQKFWNGDSSPGSWGNNDFMDNLIYSPNGL